MSFREEFDNAYHQINTYKYPSINAFHDKLSNILEAAGLPGIMDDKLDSIDEDDGTITVNTSWSVRSCECSGSSDFPSYIIDAEDPIKAAKIWGLQKKINETTNRLITAQRDVEYQQSQLESLTKSLGEAQ